MTTSTKLSSAQRIAVVSSVIRRSRQPIAKPSPVFFAMNRHAKVATLLCPKAFPAWEYVQAALGWGIMLPDGSSANGVGKCKSAEDFAKRCAHSGFTVLP